MPYPPLYNRAYDFEGWQVAAPTQPLPADRVNSELDALAATVNGLHSFVTGAITEDGRPAGAAPSGGYGASAFAATLLALNSAATWLTQLGASTYMQTLLSSASASGFRARMGVAWATVGGTADVITLTTADTGVALADGVAVEFITGASGNTGAVTVNLDGKGALALVSGAGAVLGAGAVTPNSLTRIVYRSGSWRLFTPPVVLTGDPTFDLAPVTRAYLEKVQGYDPGFRNALLNGSFDVDQYSGVLPFTGTGSYLIDRWFYAALGGSRTVSKYTVTDADRIALGDENFRTGIQMAVTGGAGVNDIEAIGQRIENVRRYAGKTITISFYARSTSGSPFVWAELSQLFGTGGAPSADVNGIGPTRFQLSTTFQRFSVQVAVPSIAGKTLGTTADSLVLLLFTSAGTGYTARLVNPAVQTATIIVTGLQVEQGTRATPFEWRPAGTELALCQRYYYRHAGHLIYSYAQAAAWRSIQTFPYPVRMRAAPSVALGPFALTNLTGTVTMHAAEDSFLRTEIVAAAAGAFFGYFTMAVSAEL